MSQFHKRCLICRSGDITDLPTYQNSFLVKCKQCSFVFSKAIPTNKELEDHYQKYNRDTYFISPITIKRYHEILDTFEPFRKTNNIIDVGCGIGSFLEVAKSRGWNVFGTEYTQKAVDICENKGIAMQKGALNISNYSREFFDIITSFEVLEHINNPVEEINNFKQLLRKGGLLYFTTPNFNAFERYYLGNQYNVIVYPEHLSYYTKKTMNQLLITNGFKKKKITTTGISLTRIKTSKGESKEEYVEAGNTDDKIRNLTEGSSLGGLIKNVINKILDWTSLGNSLKGYYTKA